MSGHKLSFKSKKRNCYHLVYNALGWKSFSYENNLSFMHLHFHKKLHLRAFKKKSWKHICIEIRILLQKTFHLIFKVLNSLPKNFLYFFPHLPLLLMSCYVLENLCENLSFFLRIFMLWINWFQCQNDSKSEKVCCGHDYTVCSHTRFFFFSCSIDLFCLVLSYFIYF